ncbi:MAG: ATP-dependent zinc metalloprotease FtsH [Frisingicoccus sp.]|uniref:ATP-dependent zinc metalloprotease FtsH n=1 Tax=Frisingicoccus sp. TaxID=1918627 RepID=UPI00260CBF8A|nr:ATP-dependent zinc metalloprotease FtsH [Frisingicoccus sp.]MDD6232197.1 ATP-dependent zinc metalloprotease FtsH [Frisingicoccus sp.]MDY4835116.1 ATP-dependent zinc metalloprotease FtsH [Frisingicoccus sp.]
MEDNNRDSNNPNKRDNRKKNIQNLVIIMITAFLAVLLIQRLFAQMQESRRKEVPYNEFLAMVDAGEVVKAEIQYDTIEFWTEDSKTAITYWTGKVDYDQLPQRLEAGGVEFKEKITDTGTMILSMLMTYVLPIVLTGLMLLWIMRSMKGGGMMGVGKSTAKTYMQKETGITFKDVAGQEESKESLTEIVDFLHNPGRYTKIGAKLPKGALLVGPPGTGKTLLAKAVAGEANVPFYSLTGSDFVEMFVGVGASRVRDLFKKAQETAPCIIFIDELDAIGKSRDSRFGGNDEREQTLNQLLSEMDGFDSSKGIIVLAATNRPEILDKAILRPGRFDRRIIVEKPDLKGRVDILKVHARNVCLDETVDFEEIGKATSGAVGSDLANIINEAALLAVKKGRNAVSQSDLFESVEVVIAGKEKKDRILSQKERKIVTYHEVGHALAAALQKNTEPVQKITIVPRTMGALGYVMQVPEEEKYLMSQIEMEEELVIMLAGRAAESIVFDSVTTGAANDIERATAMARAMVTQYGMSEKFGLMSLESVEDRYLSGHTVLNCGQETATEIDKEVMQILKSSYDKAIALLKDNRECLDKIADFLIEKETITGKEFMHIFRQVKGIPETEEGGDTNTETTPVSGDAEV